MKSLLKLPRYFLLTISSVGMYSLIYVLGSFLRISSVSSHPNFIINFLEATLVCLIVNSRVFFAFFNLFVLFFILLVFFKLKTSQKIKLLLLNIGIFIVLYPAIFLIRLFALGSLFWTFPVEYLKQRISIEGVSYKIEKKIGSQDQLLVEYTINSNVPFILEGINESISAENSKKEEVFKTFYSPYRLSLDKNSRFISPGVNKRSLVLSLSEGQTVDQKISIDLQVYSSFYSMVGGPTDNTIHLASSYTEIQ